MENKNQPQFSCFLQSFCRVRRLDAPLPPTAAQNASSKQSELSSTNETIKFSVTLARQRVVGVADPYRVGAHNAIMPITPRTRRKHSSHFLKFSAVHCRVRRLDAPLRRRRHRTQAGTKRIKQHKRNNKIFSDACASKGRRGRRPLQGRCVQCNHADNARARHEHFLYFLKFSAVHCRVQRLDAPLPPSAAQNASSEQSELNSMNIANAHSVPNFGLPDPGLNISIKQFLCKVQKIVLAK